MIKKLIVALMVLGVIWISGVMGTNSFNGSSVYAESKPEPKVWNVNYPVSGTLNPGESDRYGPYTSAVSLAVSVTWTPQDQSLSIMLYCVETGSQSLKIFYGGSGYVSWSLDYNKTYYVYVASPALSNTKTLRYSGVITVTFV